MTSRFKPGHQVRLRHGDNARGSRTPEYSAWQKMLGRCHNPRDHRFKWYGARGIAVHASWRGEGGYERFLEHVGRRPSSKHSIDRIENDKGYEPGNVRWATKIEQMRNKRDNRMVTIEGQTRCLKEWSGIFGLDYRMVHQRVRTGWDPERALRTEPRAREATKQLPAAADRGEEHEETIQ